MGFNCPKATEPLRGDSLRFITKSPKIPDTYLISVGRMKGRLNLGGIQRFSNWYPCIGNPAPQALDRSLFTEKSLMQHKQCLHEVCFS